MTAVAVSAQDLTSLAPVAPGVEVQAGELAVGGVPLRWIAEQFGTPLYVYDADILRQRARRYQQALAGLNARLCYAVKANATLSLLEVVRDCGLGADIVSAGEMQRALAAGIPASEIVFAGVGKTEEELALALTAGVGQINVESPSELALLSRVATAQGQTARVVLRINPDVDPLTHAKIATGGKETKFGIDADQALDVLRQARALPGVEPCGFAVHIGSQLTDLNPYRSAFAVLAELVDLARAEGFGIDELDLGGGLGIAYRMDDTEPDLDAYAAIIRATVGHLPGLRLTLEPGRSLVGPCGLLLTRVVHLKQGRERRFAIVDGAMNDLIRPTLYEAYHEIVPVVQAAAEVNTLDQDIVGPICETGDYFARARALPELRDGDLLAILSAGAYGSVMASAYNSRSITAEVMVEGGRVRLIRPPLTTADLLDRERSGRGPWTQPA